MELDPLKHDLILLSVQKGDLDKNIDGIES